MITLLKLSKVVIPDKIL